MVAFKVKFWHLIWKMFNIVTVCSFKILKNIHLYWLCIGLCIYKFTWQICWYMIQVWMNNETIIENNKKSEQMDEHVEWTNIWTDIYVYIFPDTTFFLAEAGLCGSYPNLIPIFTLLFAIFLCLNCVRTKMSIHPPHIVFLSHYSDTYYDQGYIVDNKT
jgi:hypothetical protein